jgi:hypothetical protein
LLHAQKSVFAASHEPNGALRRSDWVAAAGREKTAAWEIDSTFPVSALCVSGSGVRRAANVAQSTHAGPGASVGVRCGSNLYTSGKK